MASNKMLIDATHPEETRVVVLRNGRVEEFDYESASRKLLRGNIYLAKVTRVEPSLQAAFIDYGGNRHGFLAFNEIHPDYYQIPMADRQALLDEEAAAEAAEEAAADARAERLARRRQRHEGGSRDRSAGEASANGEIEEVAADEEPEVPDEAGAEAEASRSDEADERAEEDRADDDDDDDTDEAGDDDAPGTVAAAAERDETLSEEPARAEPARGFDSTDEDENDEPAAEASQAKDEDKDTESAPTAEASRTDEPSDGGVQVVAAPVGEAEAVEQTGSEDALEELPSRPRRRPRSYKIQEVIKRRQVILVQVVKEERGNKGAALTTYLSLAGRYTVLMPNTARGGGISRKITNPQDRKRLKAIAAELEVPEGMGLIIRTAGAARTKQEIKRDFEYLLRLWESVRDLTLQSTAPSLVYEEGNLIKRSIRDLYNKDVEDILVAGEHAHKDAKDFMRMLMPSHTKNVVLHQDAEPLFTKFGIERQLNAMFSPYVTLKSGGYLVINQTEALVAIDVNSGKATREFSIEETALNTNLEASDEIARQLKLRDLAGLIVIDFIDMEEKRNNRAVERRLKDALRFDRARIQLGRISHFGLMEMSRQRLRSGVLEGSTSQCPHCQGTGIIRSTESVALAVLRGLEDALMAGARTSLVATTTAQVALYILNNKRHFITEMETRHGMFIAVQASDKLQGANFLIEKGAAPPSAIRRERTAVNMDWGFEGEDAPAAADTQVEGYREENVVEVDAGDEAQPREEGGRHEGGGRRRRRRRGGRGDHDASGERGRDRGERQGTGRQPTGDIGELNGEYADAATGEGGQRGYDNDDGEGESIGASEAGHPRRDEQGGAGRRRSRGRRGGRRGRDRGRGGTHPTADRGEAGGDVYAERAGTDQPYRETDDVPAGTEPQPIPREHVSREPIAREAAPRERLPRETATVAAEHAAPTAKAPELAPAEAAAAPPPPKPRARNPATHSEPKLERVVVKPGDVGGEAVEPAAPASEPVRRGWWQRRLGAE